MASLKKSLDIIAYHSKRDLTLQPSPKPNQYEKQ